jgi:hypothetical protein
VSFADVIATFATGSYTVTRRGAGTYDSAGVFVPAATSTFSITAAVQPSNGRRLEASAAGQRGGDTRTLHTTTALRTRDNGGAPDVVTIGSESWTVIECQPWSHVGETFYRVTVEREPNP